MRFPKEEDFITENLADLYTAHYIEGNTEIHGNENKNISELNLVVNYHWITIENLNDRCWGSIDLEECFYNLSHDELMEYLNDNYEMEDITFDEVIEIIENDEFAIAEFAFNRWLQARIDAREKWWEERLARWKK